MTGTIGRALTAAAILALVTSSAAAQGLTRTEASAGGVVTTITQAGGLYLDAGALVLPTTSVVGEVQAFGARPTEFVALGGVRQRLLFTSRGDLYAQLLLGRATGYSRHCDLCAPKVYELGLGA